MSMQAMNAETPENVQLREATHAAPGVPALRYASAALACVAITAVAAPLSRELDLANVVMLYPLTVLLVAFRLGRGPAILAAFLGVALFDFFLVPPYYTFAVANVQYLLTFAVMLAVALVTGHLTAGLRREAQEAARREERARALYDMASSLAGARTVDEVDESIRSFTFAMLGTYPVMLLFDGRGELAIVGTAEPQPPIDLRMARLAADSGGFSDIDTPHPVRYQAMRTRAGAQGVLAFAAGPGGTATLARQAELLEAVASLAAISVERVRYAATVARERHEATAQKCRRAYSALLVEELSDVASRIERLRAAIGEAQRDGLLSHSWSDVGSLLDGDVESLRRALERQKAKTE